MIKVYRLAFILLLLVVAVPVYAQSATDEATFTPPNSGINLTVSPVFLSLRAKPAEAVSTQFKIRNNNAIRENLKIAILKYQIGANGQPVLADLEPNDPFPGWVTFSEPTFLLEPNVTKTIRATIQVPADAALGYYYAFVIGRVKEASVEQGAAIVGAPAIPVLLSVETPNAKKELQLVDFTTDKALYEYLPVKFTIKAKNTGNIHLVPFGDIFIDQGGKKEIAILPANETRGNILPGATRTFEVFWGDALIRLEPQKIDGKEVKDAQGRTVYKPYIDGEKPLNTFRIGKYTAHLLMVYDNGERDIPLEAKVSFWVVPWKILLLAIFIALVPFIIFMVVNKVKNRKRK